MATLPTKAGPQVCQSVNEVKSKNHPHLGQAMIAVEFEDSKPYVRDKLNLGKVRKISPSMRLLLPANEKYDFLITICTDVWYDLLSEAQKEPYIDLLLSRCRVQYEPNTVVVNGKKQVVKDEYGRVEYTDQIKTDDEGRPAWKAVGLDISVTAENVKRYGVWYEELVALKKALDAHKEV